MHECVNRAEFAPAGGAVERHHDPGNGARAQADANEMSGEKLQPVGHEIAESARWPAHPREDRHLRGPGGHRSYRRGFLISFRTISAISFTVLSILPSSFTTT